MKKIGFLKRNKTSCPKAKDEIFDILKSLLNILKLRLLIKILELFE